MQSAVPAPTKVLASHFVTLEFKDKKLSSINQMEWSKDGFFLGAYSHFGGALFSLAYQDNELHSKISPAIPSYFNADFVLRDYQLSFLPVDAIEQGLVDDSVEVYPSELKRVFRRDNQELVSIEYTTTQPWLGDTKLVNHEYGYTLTFEALP
ncbi:MAG: DUF3261 domain-containing protein [Pseudomonadales bacterium]|nr:DUF3261 domain-containing protein [Pseudomonadales bacterium]